MSCVSTESDNSVRVAEPVILIAGFGSSYDTGIANLEDFDVRIRQSFPDNEVLWGFTSSFIVNKLRKTGTTTLFDSRVPLFSLEEAYHHLLEQGRRNVLVVIFHIMRGVKHKQVLDTPTPGLNVKYIHPLLYYEENIENSVLALEDKIASTDETATVFCAHGNGKNPQYNAELEMINNYLQFHYKNTYLVSLEGTPSWEPIRRKILESGVSRVQFITYMLTFGDHMLNDVSGDEDDSLKSQLGLPAEVTDGLAAMPGFQNMFIDRIEDTLEQFKGL